MRHEAWLRTGACLFAVAAASHAQAAVLWDGDASKGTGVFKGLECVAGKITVDQDPKYGPVWKFFFPDGDKRCEVRGSKDYVITENTDIFVGWRVKYDIALGSLRYVFQMKGYPPPALESNHPVVFATEQNNLVLINYVPGDKRKTIWSSPIEHNKWMTVVLHMKMSKNPATGYIELWFNGQKQKFSDGSDRIPANTFDAGITDVKWGIYRGGQGPGDCMEWLGSPKIGTTYEDVAPGESGGSAGDAAVVPVVDASAAGGSGGDADAAGTTGGSGGAGTGGELGASGGATGAGSGGAASGSGGGGTGGSAGGAGSGGRSGSGGAPRTGGSGNSSGPAEPSSSSGCTIGGAISGAPAAAAGIALAALAWRRRRRRG
jgi:hypothetical protein